MRVCFCRHPGIQHGRWNHRAFYPGLQNDTHGTSFYSGKSGYYEAFCKEAKRIMDEFITESEKYAGWFGDTVGGVREVKLFGILENKRAEFADRQLSVINKQKR